MCCLLSDSDHVPKSSPEGLSKTNIQSERLSISINYFTKTLCVTGIKEQEELVYTIGILFKRKR